MSRVTRGVVIPSHNIIDTSAYRLPDCLCDLDDSEPEERAPDDGRPCKKHYSCCPICQPTCYGKPPTKREIREEIIDDPTVSILDLLHPIPQALQHSSYDNRELVKTENRKHEIETWQVHTNMLKNLAHNPYEDCICDVVGLEDAFQIVQDSRSRIDYAHRPDCLIYPNAERWEADPRHSHRHARHAPDIQHFRDNGRSRTGRKQFRKKTVLELIRSCGVQHHLERAGASDDEQDSSEMDRPQSPVDQENDPVQYDSRTIAADILRVASIHPSRPPLNPHLNPQPVHEPTSHATPPKKQKRKRQRASTPNPKKFKSAEFVVPDSD